jgi:hypothetical protein
MIWTGVGEIVWRLRRRPRLTSKSEEFGLETVDLALERHDIEFLILVAKSLFAFRLDVHAGKQSGIGRLGLVVASRDMTSSADFLLKLHDRLKEVGVEPEMAVEQLQKLELLGCIIAVVADRATNNGVVLLFNVARVVFSVWPAACEGDVLIDAVVDEMSVDKLAAVVRVKAEKLKRKSLSDILQSVEDVTLGLILHGCELCPTGDDIGQRQGMAAVAIDATTVMRDEIHLAKAWPGVIPLREGSDGDLVFEQCARSSGCAAMEQTLLLRLDQ